MSLVTERGSAGPGSDRPAGPRIDDVVRVLFGGANGLAEAASEDAVCFVALETCLRAVGARGGSIRLLEQHELRLAHQLVDDLGGDGLTATLRRRDAAFDLDGASGAALAARTGEVVAFERPEDYDGLPDSAVPDRSRGCIYVPLRLAGRAVGTIGMGFAGFVGFAPEVREALASFGTQVAQALERVELRRTQERALTALALSGARMAALQRVTRAFARSMTVEEVFSAALDAVDEALQPDAAVVVRVEETIGAVRCVDARGRAAPAPGELLGHPFNAVGPLGTAVRHGTANWFHGAAVAVTSPGWPRSGGAVPLLGERGPAGALAVLYTHSRPVPAADRTLFAAIGELCGEALRRASAGERERRLAARRLLLRGAAADLAGAGGVDGVLEVAVRAAADALGGSWPVQAALVTRQGPDAAAGLGARLCAPGGGGTAPRFADVDCDDAPAPVAAVLRALEPGGELPWTSASSPVGRATTVRGALVFGVDADSLLVLVAPAEGRLAPPAEHEAVLRSLGRLVQEGLQRVLIKEQKRRADARAAALHVVTRALSRSVTVGEVLHATVRSLRESLDPISGGAVIVTGATHLGWVFDRPDEPVRATAGPDPFDPLLAAVLADGRPRFYESAAEVRAEFGPGPVGGRFLQAGLHLPVQVDGVAVGVLGCEFGPSRRITAEDRELAVSLASLAGEAMRRARLYEDEHRNAARQALLRALAEEVADTGDSGVVLDALEGALAALLGPLRLLALLDADGRLRRCRGERSDPLPPLLQGLIDRAAPEAARAFPAGDLCWLPADAAVVAGTRTEPVAGLETLLGGQGEVFGVAVALFERPRAIGPEDRAAVADAVLTAREALRRARARHHERRAALRTAVLHRVTGAVSGATTSEDVLRVAVAELHDALDAVATCAGIVEGDRIRLVHACGELATLVGEPSVPTDAYWVVDEVLRTGRPLWHDDEDPLLVRRPARIDDRPFTAWSAGAVLPIEVDGVASGALVLGIADGRRLETEDRELLETVARLCGEAMRRARLYDEAASAARRYELLFRRHPQPMAVIEHGEAPFLAVNEAHVRVLGYEEHELLQLVPNQLVVDADGAELRRLAVEAGPDPDDARVFPLLRFRRKDGSTFIGRLTTAPVDFDGRSARLALLTDETDRVQAETDRSRLQARVLSVAEEERRRISLDLHDGPVQDLSIAVMRLSALRAAVERGEVVPAGKLTAIERATRLTVDGLRSLMQRLYPTTLPDADLVGLLEEVIATGPWSDTIEVAFHHELHCPVALTARAAIYRVVIEALTNVYKHAQAATAIVDLRDDERAGFLRLRISDDGIGISDDDRDRRGHLGLVSMQDRIALLGGRCTIGAGPHGGTVVDALVPCPCDDPGDHGQR
ncbi:MAG: GAF domain-containing protein [Acidimicrobiia bacterium]